MATGAFEILLPSTFCQFVSNKLLQNFFNLNKKVK